MLKASSPPHVIRSINELHHLFALPGPTHPLVSVIDFALLSFKHSDVWRYFTNSFYCVVLKQGVNGQFMYGQSEFDFDAGMMSFTKPGQVFSVINIRDKPVTGFMLVFKAELLHQHPLMNTIKNYNYFSYSVAESLHLSEQEVATISLLFGQMQQEIRGSTDSHSQELLVSYLDLILKYANRFYARQFITRKHINHELIGRLDRVLASYFEEGKNVTIGPPKVHLLATELHLSVNYLSDVLRNVTGQNTQQYIHSYLIERAKELLGSTDLTVNEIAYGLGFDYAQSFNKLFKKKTSQTPLEYRASLN